MKRILLATALAALPFTSGAQTEPAAPQIPAPAALQKEVVLTYTKIVQATYEDGLTAAKQLRKDLGAFVKTPSAKTLKAAKESWIKARQPYLQSEVFRYYAGPIDDADGPEPLMNSWPLDEMYIDAAEGGQGGIIANVRDYPEINVKTITELNLKDGEKNISTGWHAIEFLLWGQDKSVTGPGDRPFTDFTTAPNAKRRGAYLIACADMLIENFTDLNQQWAPDNLGNYRAVFEEGVPYSIERILTGLIFLSGTELAGERLQVAWDTQEQEEEHSCFSDTTNQDTIYDALGALNVYRGRYVRLDGTKIEGKCLRDLAVLVKPDLVPDLDAKMEGTYEKAKLISAPFDQAILGEDTAPGRQAIMAVIASAEDQAAYLRRLARALKIEIPEEAVGDIAG